MNHSCQRAAFVWIFWTPAEVQHSLLVPWKAQQMRALPKDESAVLFSLKAAASAGLCLPGAAHLPALKIEDAMTHHLALLPRCRVILALDCLAGLPHFLVP